MATACNERIIARHFEEMAERGEPLALDPDAPEVADLREHCRREVAQHESDRQRKACAR